MIKVIKHGHHHAPYQMTCKNCECVFTFEDYDIKGSVDRLGYEGCIYCPECGYSNAIRSREDCWISKDNYLTWY